ncbi:hypothetical protein HQ489_05245 [Candidatus Woesearchaeota archaeon]|nr:hypothetical protein [Candidatus Woesearchaeota archaeon]
MISWKELRKKIIAKYEEKSPVAVEDLMWLKKTIKAGEEINWSFVDTVDYNLDSIPVTRELVLEFKAKPKEVMEKCQNLLNWKKERL